MLIIEMLVYNYLFYSFLSLFICVVWLDFCMGMYIMVFYIYVAHYAWLTCTPEREICGLALFFKMTSYHVLMSRSVF